MSEQSKPIDELALQLADLSTRLGDCRDPQTRKDLLLQMRIALREAERLAFNVPPENEPKRSSSDSEK